MDIPPGVATGDSGSSPLQPLPLFYIKRLKMKEKTDNIRGLLIWLPDDVKRKFKAAVIANGQSLKSVLLSFIQEYIEKSEVKK